jgi:hypothetical protein
VLILLVYYPDGEEAMGSLTHMVVVILLAILTMVSMLWPDPLRLRAKPDKPSANLDPIAVQETLAVPLPVVVAANDEEQVPPELQEPAMSVGSSGESRSDLAPQ